MPLLMLLNKLNIKVIFWMHFADYSGKNRFKSNLLNYFFNRSQKYAWQNAEIISVPNSKIVKHFESLMGKSNCEVFTLQNLPKSVIHSYKVDLLPTDKLKIVIACSEVLPKFLILETLQSISLISKSFKFKVSITGKITDKDYYVKILEITSKQRNIEIEFTELISIQKCNDLIRDSHIGIALYADDEEYTRYGNSLKVWQYLQYGLIVIGSKNVSPMSLVSQQGGGWAIARAEEIKDIIQNLSPEEIWSRRSQSFKLFKQEEAKELAKKSNFYFRYQEIFGKK
jgi:hypothetical protein